MEQKNYHVIIIGGGSSGMGAAYALKGRGYNVAVIEQQEELGGTACTSWVDSWIGALIPPHIERIFKELPAESKYGNIENAWLRDVYAEPGKSNGLWMKKEDLSAKYAHDLEGKVTLFTKYRFVRVLRKEEKQICSIEIESLENRQKKELFSSFFIDSSADGVLCRSANPIEGTDFYWGRDPQKRYNESVAAVNVDSCKEYLNEPSLFFNIVKGYDDSKLLSLCKTVYADYNSNGTIQTIHKPDYLQIDGYCSKGIVNPMTALGSGKIGFEVLHKGIDCTYSEFEKRIVEFWKFLKLSLQKSKEEGKNGIGAWDLGYLSWGYAGKSASYLGVRETYRIHCERMLNQNDLVRLIDPNRIGHFIATGSHTVDFHIVEGLNVDEINKLNGYYKEKEYQYPLIRPYGIPYECLIPRNLNNVLVASRCFGASQIALASARINMVMAQLGWVAGNAILVCLAGKLSNVRDIDISQLQSDDYTEFSSRTFKMYSKYNSRLKNELDLQKTV